MSVGDTVDPSQDITHLNAADPLAPPGHGAGLYTADYAKLNSDPGILSHKINSYDDLDLSALDAEQSDFYERGNSPLDRLNSTIKAELSSPTSRPLGMMSSGAYLHDQMNNHQLNQQINQHMNQQMAQRLSQSGPDIPGSPQYLTNSQNMNGNLGSHSGSHSGISGHVAGGVGGPTGYTDTPQKSISSGSSGSVLPPLTATESNAIESSSEDSLALDQPPLVRNDRRSIGGGGPHEGEDNLRMKYAPTASSSPPPLFVIDLPMIRRTMDGVNQVLGVDLGGTEVGESALLENPLVRDTDDASSTSASNSTSTTTASSSSEKEGGSSKAEMSHVRLISDACGYITASVSRAVLTAAKESIEESITLGVTNPRPKPPIRKKRGGILGFKELAQRANLSPWHFHRVFRFVTGVTPKAYGEALWEYLMIEAGFDLEHEEMTINLAVKSRGPGEASKAANNITNSSSSASSPSSPTSGSRERSDRPQDRATEGPNDRSQELNGELGSPESQQNSAAGAAGAADSSATAAAAVAAGGTSAATDAPRGRSRAYAPQSGLSASGEPLSLPQTASLGPLPGQMPPGRVRKTSSRSRGARSRSRTRSQSQTQVLAGLNLEPVSSEPTSSLPIGGPPTRGRSFSRAQNRQASVSNGANNSIQSPNSANSTSGSHSSASNGNEAAVTGSGSGAATINGPSAHNIPHLPEGLMPGEYMPSEYMTNEYIQGQYGEDPLGQNPLMRPSVYGLDIPDMNALSLQHQQEPGGADGLGGDRMHQASQQYMQQHYMQQPQELLESSSAQYSPHSDSRHHRNNSGTEFLHQGMPGTLHGSPHTNMQSIQSNGYLHAGYQDMNTPGNMSINNSGNLGNHSNLDGNISSMSSMSNMSSMGNMGSMGSMNMGSTMHNGNEVSPHRHFMHQGPIFGDQTSTSSGTPDEANLQEDLQREMYGQPPLEDDKNDQLGDLPTSFYTGVDDKTLFGDNSTVDEFSSVLIGMEDPPLSAAWNEQNNPDNYPY